MEELIVRNDALTSGTNVIRIARAYNITLFAGKCSDNAIELVWLTFQ